MWARGHTPREDSSVKTQTHTGREPGADRGRDQLGCHTPRIGSNHQKLGEGPGADSPSEPPRRNQPC